MLSLEKYTKNIPGMVMEYLKVNNFFDGVATSNLGNGEGYIFNMAW